MPDNKSTTLKCKNQFKFLTKRVLPELTLIKNILDSANHVRGSKMEKDNTLERDTYGTGLSPAGALKVNSALLAREL